MVAPASKKEPREEPGARAVVAREEGTGSCRLTGTVSVWLQDKGNLLNATERHT